MIAILSSAQIREVDAYTIAHEPIASVDLMERAAKAFVCSFAKHFPNKAQGISIYCGTGNNGGDGLAIARLLKQNGYNHISVKVLRYSANQSANFTHNLDRLKEVGIGFSELLPGQEIKAESASILIDAMLGTGLNKPLAGDYARLVSFLNKEAHTVVAVDVPTGFFTEGVLPAGAAVLEADLVITFQQAKLNFMLPESAAYIKGFEVVDIGLDRGYIASLQSSYQMTEEADVRQMLKKRDAFSHKGTYGHALLIAGQPQTMGAALLCASACVHAGAGLTTAYVPQSGLTALNARLPEAMALVRKPGDELRFDLDKYNAIAIGPGLGNSDETLSFVNYIINNYRRPVLVDADGLNVLGSDNRLLKVFPL